MSGTSVCTGPQTCPNEEYYLVVAREWVDSLSTLDITVFNMPCVCLHLVRSHSHNHTTLNPFPPIGPDCPSEGHSVIFVLHRSVCMIDDKGWLRLHFHDHAYHSPPCHPVLFSSMFLVISGSFAALSSPVLNTRLMLVGRISSSTLT